MRRPLPSRPFSCNVCSGKQTRLLHLHDALPIYPGVTGPSAEGPLPATGSVAAMITAATGIRPYYIGKPNPLMMRTALIRIGAHSETSVMIGDRMDTDV